MSEVWQGPGWWQASDGLWYPPEQHPGYFVPAPSEVAPWPQGPAVPITSGLAVAALGSAVLWIGGLGSLLAVILGMVALSQIRSSSGRQTGAGLATAGLVIGAVGLVGAVALYSSGAVTGHALASSGLPATAGPLEPPLRPASAAVLRKLTSVPPRVVNAVGLPPPSIVSPPTVDGGQPDLVVDGKPGAVFIGGVFCPYCAAERWAIIMAFSRFGSFSHLQETTSSPWEVYPSTATFSFQGASYSSRYVGLAMSEHSGNDVDGPGTDPVLEPLTRQEASLWQRYDDSYGYPFLDIGNEAFVLSPSFTPGLLSGFDQEQIDSRLSVPADPSTEAIVGASDYLTAAICATTGQRPVSVCAAPVVVKAGKAMDLKGRGRLAAPVAAGVRSAEKGQDLGRDQLDDLLAVVPHRIVGSRVVEHDVGESEGLAAAHEVGEGTEAGQRSLVGVAAEVDPLDGPRIAAETPALLCQVVELPSHGGVGAGRRQVTVGGVTVGDPGVGPARHQGQRARIAAGDG